MAFGVMGRRSYGLSELWAVGVMGCRSNGSSELWAPGLLRSKERCDAKRSGLSYDLIFYTIHACS